MKVSQAVTERHSVRAFTNQAVSEDIIKDILRDAGRSPSGANTQPWHVVVLTGAAKGRLQDRIESAFRNGDRGNMDYPYYPEIWEEPYKARRLACGFQLYDALGIAREDKQRRMDQWVANYRAFDAPVMMIFLIEDVMQTGSYMDYGMFLQSVMLLALEQGLGTCPQAALAEYPDIVRDELSLDDNVRVLCGMALGYEDCDAVVNRYRTPREPVENYVTFRTV
ncbi:MAG: nitroreductase [Gammaproteobacteria bacterium]|nr:nitroreductase [Gammaproteobacteria bacterium]